MILHLTRMRRNVNWKVYNDRKNVSATSSPIAVIGDDTGSKKLGFYRIATLTNLQLHSSLKTSALNMAYFHRKQATI